MHGITSTRLADTDDLARGAQRLGFERVPGNQRIHGIELCDGVLTGAHPQAMEEELLTTLNAQVELDRAGLRGLQETHAGVPVGMGPTECPQQDDWVEEQGPHHTPSFRSSSSA